MIVASRREVVLFRHNDEPLMVLAAHQGFIVVRAVRSMPYARTYVLRKSSCLAEPSGPEHLTSLVLERLATERPAAERPATDARLKPPANTTSSPSP
jgi:hypothetical protein